MPILSCKPIGIAILEETTLARDPGHPAGLRVELKLPNPEPLPYDRP
jgi:hypothetical protein